MNIVVKQSYKWMDKERKLMTYQNEFNKNTKCHKCNATSILFILIDDNEGLIQQSRPRQLPPDHIWPHDCMAIALYLCSKCGEITTLWNQA